MVFSWVLFFDFGVVVIDAGSSALTAAGPFGVFDLGLLCFLFFFDVDFRGDGSGLVAAAAAAGDGGSTGAPPSAPGLRDVDAAASAVDPEEGGNEEAAALSRAHSSLWPARHAARWQASLQYFRCRQLEQKFSRCCSFARVPQCAHFSI